MADSSATPDGGRDAGGHAPLHHDGATDMEEKGQEDTAGEAPPRILESTSTPSQGDLVDTDGEPRHEATDKGVHDAASGGNEGEGTVKESEERDLEQKDGDDDDDDAAAEDQGEQFFKHGVYKALAVLSSRELFVYSSEDHRELLDDPDGPALRRPEQESCIVLADGNPAVHDVVKYHVWRVTAVAAEVPSCFIVRPLDPHAHGLQTRTQLERDAMAHGGRWDVVKEVNKGTWPGQRLGTFEPNQVVYTGPMMVTLSVRELRPRVGTLVKFKLRSPDEAPGTASAPGAGGNISKHAFKNLAKAGMAKKLGLKWRKKITRDLELERSKVPLQVWVTLKHSGGERIEGTSKLRPELVTFMAHFGEPHNLANMKDALRDALNIGGEWHVLSDEELENAVGARTIQTVTSGANRGQFSGTGHPLRQVVDDPGAPEIGPGVPEEFGDNPPPRFAALIRLHYVKDCWSLNDETAWMRATPTRRTPHTEVWDVVVWDGPGTASSTYIPKASNLGIHLYRFHNAFDPTYADRTPSVGAWVAYRESFRVARHDLPALAPKKNRFGAPILNLHSAEERSTAVKNALVEFGSIIHHRGGQARFAIVRLGYGAGNSGFPCGFFDNLMSPTDSADAMTALADEWGKRVECLDMSACRAPTSYFELARLFENSVRWLVVSETGSHCLSVDDDYIGNRKLARSGTHARLGTVQATDARPSSAGDTDNAALAPEELELIEAEAAVEAAERSDSPPAEKRAAIAAARKQRDEAVTALDTARRKAKRKLLEETAWDARLVRELNPKLGDVDDAMLKLIREASRRWRAGKATAARRRLQLSLSLLDLDAVGLLMRSLAPAAAKERRLRERVRLAAPPPEPIMLYCMLVTRERPPAWDVTTTDHGDAAWAVATVPPLVDKEATPTNRSNARRASIASTKSDAPALPNLPALLSKVIRHVETNQSMFDWPGTTVPEVEEARARYYSDLLAREKERADARAAIQEYEEAAAAEEKRRAARERRRAARSRRGGRGGSRSPKRSPERGGGGRKAKERQRSLERRRSSAALPYDAPLPDTLRSGLRIKCVEALTLPTQAEFARWMREESGCWPLPLPDIHGSGTR